MKIILCFQGPQEAKLGSKVDVVFTFKNPLLEELSNCFLTVEGTRLRRPITFTIPLVYKAQLMKYKYIDLRLRWFINMNWNVYQNLVWNILQDQHILICRTFCNDNRTLWSFFGRFFVWMWQWAILQISLQAGSGGLGQINGILKGVNMTSFPTMHYSSIYSSKCFNRLINLNIIAIYIFIP